jgi:hypothetical protein
MFRSNVVRCVIAGACIAHAGHTHAQVVRGTVVDAGERGVALVHVTATAAGGTTAASAVSDSVGVFQLALTSAGTYTLAASHIGYESSAPVVVQLRVDEEIDVRIRVDAAALRLGAIDVTARRRMPYGRAALQRRIEQMKQQGIGRFAVRDDIVRMRPQTTTRLLAQVAPSLRIIETRDVTVNSVLMRRATGYCAPALFLDGMRMNQRPFNANAVIDPDRIEAVEIYTGSAQIPSGYHDPQGCGTILLWSRVASPDDPGARPFTWSRLAIAGALALGALLLLH